MTSSQEICMDAAAQKLKAAIAQRSLAIKPGQPVLGRFPEIVIDIKRDEFARLKCLQVSPPRAWLADSRKTVHVRPSERLAGGFDVDCETEEDAVLIVDTLTDGFNRAHTQLFK